VVAVGAGSRHQNVDAGAAEFGARDEFDAGDAAAFVADGAGAEQVEDGGFGGAAGLGDAGGPEDVGEFLGVCAVVFGAVGGDEFIGLATAADLGLGRGDDARIEAVEIAAAGDGVGIAQRFVEGAGFDPAAFEDVEDGGEFARGGAEVFGVAGDVGLEGRELGAQRLEGGG
jgi:hypothetical protein